MSNLLNIVPTARFDAIDTNLAVVDAVVDAIRAVDVAGITADIAALNDLSIGQLQAETDPIQVLILALNNLSLAQLVAETDPINVMVGALNDLSLGQLQAETNPIVADIAALNNLSVAQVQTETNAIVADIAALNNLSTGDIDTRLTVYDSPTRAEATTDKDAILTRINSKDAARAAIQTVVDANAILIAALKEAPELEFLYTATTNSAFETVLEVTGAGILYECVLNSGNVSDTGEIRITIDGETNIVMEVSNNEQKSVKRQISEFSSRYLEIAVDNTAQYINLQFQNSLLIEVRRSIGTTASIVSTIIYGEY